MDTKQAYSVTQKNLLLFGAILAIIGSFLPWEIEGDFISYWRYGVQIFPVFADNGGFIVLLLGIFIIGLILRSSGFVKRPTIWILICSIVLSIISVYHVVDWLTRRIISNGIIGAPEIKIGLILVGIGSLLTLTTALFVNFKTAVNNVHEKENLQTYSNKPK
jgi:hypothetical protein